MAFHQVKQPPSRGRSIFPWGSNNPTRIQRIVVALCAGVLGGLLHYVRSRGQANFHADFGEVWFGANALLHGADPYGLVGPGRVFDFEWGLLYPGTALVVGLPFTALSEQSATYAFVFISSLLLAYGISRDSWHRLPIFATEAFASSAQLAQWSIVLTAALFIPWLAFLTVAKPQAGIPVLAVSSRQSLKTAAIGGAALLVISLVLLPTWPLEWLHEVRATGQLRAPVFRFGGFLVLLLLLRWRRPESWLILTMAFMPQSWGWYNVLMLFAIPATFVEASLLALLSTGGAIALPYVVRSATTPESFYSAAAAVLVCSSYLPAVFIVLRRPNRGDPPEVFVALKRLFRSVVGFRSGSPQADESGNSEARKVDP